MVMALTNNVSNKERSDDRLLFLKVQEGKSPHTTTGLIDKRLFTGENKMHAVMDSETSLWAIKYDKGGLPEALKQKFTSFSKLKNYVEIYFKGRNIEIEKIVD